MAEEESDQRLRRDLIGPKNLQLVVMKKWPKPGKERAPPVAAELEDYIRVTLPRRRLARWCHEPYFDRAVIGCFVRLFIGESEDGKKCYRLCEIVDVDKSKSEYKFPVASSKEKPVRFRS